LSLNVHSTRDFLFLQKNTLAAKRRHSRSRSDRRSNTIWQNAGFQRSTDSSRHRIPYNTL